MENDAENLPAFFGLRQPTQAHPSRAQAGPPLSPGCARPNPATALLNLAFSPVSTGPMKTTFIQISFSLRGRPGERMGELARPNALSANPKTPQAEPR